jgi:hypothetical protein
MIEVVTLMPGQELQFFAQWNQCAVWRTVHSVHGTNRLAEAAASVHRERNSCRVTLWTAEPSILKE